MGTRELARHRELSERLQMLRKRGEKIELIWCMVKRQRRELAEEVSELEAEREILEQGQLLFEDQS